MEQGVLRWCPHCKRTAAHAALGATATDAVDHRSPWSDEPHLSRRNLYCCECRAVWEACEGPAEFIDSLLDLRDALDAAQRQIAMLRLLLAKERNVETIRLSEATRRAA